MIHLKHVRLRAILLVVSSGFVAACNDPPVPPAPSLDAALPDGTVLVPLPDATSPVSEGSTAVQDAPVDSLPSEASDASAPADGSEAASPSSLSDGSVADAAALVAQCQTLAMQFAASCQNQVGGDAPAPDTQRVCIWNAYAQLCATGNAKLLVDSMSCFAGNPNCWTFSDCNTACTCLGTVHSAEESATAQSVIQSACVACGTDCTTTLAQAEVLPYLPDSELTAFLACTDGGCAQLDSGVECASVDPAFSVFSCK
jgi:hypothetical protein